MTIIEIAVRLMVAAHEGGQPITPTEAVEAAQELWRLTHKV